jgi:hypothetical protein
MALTITTTAMSASANSYVSLAECDAWFEAIIGFWATWDALSSAEQNARIIESARAIDRFRYRFIGGKTDEDQAMEFPRAAELTIPEAVKRAQYNMLIYLMANPAVSASGSSIQSGGGGAGVITGVEVPGVVKVAYSERRAGASGTDATAKIGTIEAVMAELAEWLTGGASGANSIPWIK